MALDYNLFLITNIFLQISNPNLLTMIESWFFENTVNSTVIIGSLLMGIIGSTAYLVASKLGFIKFNQNSSFQQIGYGKAFGYSLIGGAVATVFQIPELPNFIPIQSFVLGITWPLLVAQYTSKSEPSQSKKELLEKFEGW